MLFKQRVPDAVTNRRHSGLSKAMLFAQQVGCVSNVVKTQKHCSRSGMQAFWLETPIKTKLSTYIVGVTLYMHWTQIKQHCGVITMTCLWYRAVSLQQRIRWTYARQQCCACARILCVRKNMAHKTHQDILTSTTRPPSPRCVFAQCHARLKLVTWIVFRFCGSSESKSFGDSHQRPASAGWEPVVSSE